MNRRDALKVFAGGVVAAASGVAVADADVLAEKDLLVVTMPDGVDYTQCQSLVQQIHDKFPNLKGRIIVFNNCKAQVMRDVE